MVIKLKLDLDFTTEKCKKSSMLMLERDDAFKLTGILFSYCKCPLNYMPTVSILLHAFSCFLSSPACLTLTAQSKVQLKKWRASKKYALIKNKEIQNNLYWQEFQTTFTPAHHH